MALGVFRDFRVGFVWRLVGGLLPLCGQVFEVLPVEVVGTKARRPRAIVRLREAIPLPAFLLPDASAIIAIRRKRNINNCGDNLLFFRYLRFVGTLLVSVC